MLPTLLLAGSLAVGQPPQNCTPTPSVTDCLWACPCPNDPAPFLRTPKLDALGDCKDGSDCGGETDLRKKHQWRHVFSTAAKFSIPRFGQGGEPAEADGVVIYEGMRLTVNHETGVYDLSFTATTPPTPVTIRLQLTFHRPDCPDDCVKLTLPPIEIEPTPTSNELRPKANTVRVSHRGFSEVFLCPDKQSDSSDLMGKPLGLKKMIQPVTSDWAITRAGTARFGSAQATNEEPGR